jgi:hypothetical protein
MWLGLDKEDGPSRFFITDYESNGKAILSFVMKVRPLRMIVSIFCKILTFTNLIAMFMNLKYLRMYSPSKYSSIDIHSKCDRKKIYRLLLRMNIFKKFMPAYLQFIDLSDEGSKKGDSNTLEQLKRKYKNSKKDVLSKFEKHTWDSEDSFLDSYNHFELTLPSDEDYMNYRRDLMILDIHNLIQFTGKIKSINSFELATTNLKKYAASYLFDFLFRDEETMDFESMKYIYALQIFLDFNLFN